MLDHSPLPAANSFPFVEAAWTLRPPAGKFQMAVIVLDMDVIQGQSRKL
jgi:hypothetical protein